MIFTHNCALGIDPSEWAAPPPTYDDDDEDFLDDDDVPDDMWNTVPTSVQSNVTDYFPDEKSLRPAPPPPVSSLRLSPQ